MEKSRPPGGKPNRGHGEAGRALLPLLGHRVTALRAANGLTRAALAANAGLSGRFIAQLETGRGNISVTNLAAVAAGLGVTPAVLLGEKPLPGDGAEFGAERLRAEILSLLGDADPGVLPGVKAALAGHRRQVTPRPVISLMGLRGAGKSTVGPLVARELGIGFVELDDLVREQTGLALAELYELHGEPYYRRAEYRALRELVAAEVPTVVAVSGGIVHARESFRLLKERTRLVWLKASPGRHMERVRSQGDQRPMRDRPDAMVELRRLLRNREPLYSQAGTTVDTTRLSPEACAKRVARELAQPVG